MNKIKRSPADCELKPNADCRLQIRRTKTNTLVPSRPPKSGSPILLNYLFGH